MIENGPQTVNDEYQDLYNAIYAKEYPEALKILSTFNDKSRVDSIVQVLAEKHLPLIWFAAFENKMLKEEMDSRHLHILIPHLNRMRLKYLVDPILFKLCNDIFQNIISHRDWCGMLSYSYFIGLTNCNSDLARAISCEPHFIRMLEPVHLLKLIIFHPKFATNIITVIAQNFKNQQNYNDLWAKETIKYLFEKSPIVRKAVNTEVEFYPLKQFLNMENGNLVEQASDEAEKLQQALNELKFDSESTAREAEIDDDHFNKKNYSKQDILMNYLGKNVSQELSDEEDAEDDEQPQQETRGLTKTRSFYLK